MLASAIKKKMHIIHWQVVKEKMVYIQIPFLIKDDTGFRKRLIVPDQIEYI